MLLGVLGGQPILLKVMALGLRLSMRCRVPLMATSALRLTLSPAPLTTSDEGLTRPLAALLALRSRSSRAVHQAVNYAPIANPCSHRSQASPDPAVDAIRIRGDVHGSCQQT